MNLQKELRLPCGATLVNRIAKSAMSENMARQHQPTKALINVYKKWAAGGTGLIITGNVMIDKRAIGEPGNVVVEDESNFELLQEWASVVKGTNLHIWPQLNHPGRQAIAALNKNIVAPSSVGLNMPGMAFMFKQPRALEEAEILDIIERFGNTAAILQAAGFTGVQIHGAHGYLVSQFLSPLSNQRKDQWGGSLKNRARFVLEVYRSIREKVGPAFPVGIKINSADFQRGGFMEEESMAVVKMLDTAGMDLIEISGGTYEQPEMMGVTKKQSTLEREAFFMDYVKKVRKVTQTPLMLTGGFRTVATMKKAVADGHLDVIGLARPFSLYPNLPNRIFDGSLSLLEVPVPRTGIKGIDAGGFIDIAWHQLQMTRMGKGKAPKANLSAYAALWHNLLGFFRKKIFNI